MATATGVGVVGCVDVVLDEAEGFETLQREVLQREKRGACGGWFRCSGVRFLLGVSGGVLR